MIPALRKSLEEVGLHHNELAVFTTLLEHGPLLVSGLARIAGLNRTTTYGVLKTLAEKGLVSSTKKQGALRYQSIAPEQLPAYLERRRESLAETKKEIVALIPQLKLLRSRGRTLPRVQFFEGIEGVKQAYEDTLENNHGKKLYDITGVEAVYSRLDEKWIRYYLEKRKRLGIQCTALAAESPAARKAKAEDAKYLRTTKFLPPEYNFAAELSLYDDKIGMFSYSQESPVALIIEDATIADMMKKLFAALEETAH